MSDYSDLELQEQLMNQLEEMQTEIDRYKQTIADLQAEVSKKDSQILEAVEQAESFSKKLERIQSANSSQVQELASTVQQQKKKIAEQTELIEKLSESDLIVQENNRLKKLNSDLQKSERNAKQEARAKVESVKEEYARKEQLLADERAEAKQKINEAELLTRQSENEIRTRVSKETFDIEKKIKWEYQAVVGCAMLYSILVTVFTASKSKTFVADFKAFFGAIWNFISLAFGKLLQVASGASQVADKIPQRVLSVILHWLIIAVIVGGVIALVGFLLFIALRKLWCFYTDYRYTGFVDGATLAEVIISLAVIVWFAEPIQSVLSVNLLLLYIIVHVAYIALRWYIIKRRGW